MVHFTSNEYYISLRCEVKTSANCATQPRSHEMLETDNMVCGAGAMMGLQRQYKEQDFVTERGRSLVV